MDRNREGWLTELARLVEPVFVGTKLKPYRVTCGWPCKGALARKKRRVGECHGGKSSADGTHEIFISPVLAEPLEVAGTVCHELVHVAAGIEAGHEKGFVRFAKHVGLTKGKPTEAMPGPVLEERLTKLVARLGPYPHKALRPAGKDAKPAEPSVTLKCDGCGCPVRIQVKWYLQTGPLTCGCGGTLLTEDEGE